MGRQLRSQEIGSRNQYRRMMFVKQRSDLRHESEEDPGELSAESWCQACVEDAWHIQTHAMIHVCGPSCWKYNKNGVRVCRHHCYHITTLSPDAESVCPAEKPIKLRRDGKPLNNQLYIQEDAARGRRGRVVPIAVHPNETTTNYAAANSLRCNFDCQSMLYLPPQSVLALDVVPNVGPRPEYQRMERQGDTSQNQVDDLDPKWLLDPLEEDWI